MISSQVGGAQESMIEMKSRPQHQDATASPIHQQQCENGSSNKSFCQQFIHESAWPGMGLFGESYLLFSIGTLKPLWEYLYPLCFQEETCTPRLLNSLTYSVVLGIMIGMVGLGYAANHVGRRKGSIMTASFMCSSAWGLALTSISLSNNAVWMYRSLSVLFFIFGIGVGGEYPLSASSASERAMAELKRKQAEELEKLVQNEDNNVYYKELTDQDRKKSKPGTDVTVSNKSQGQDKRGRGVQLVFTMQGIGILFNSITMTALLLITGQGQISNGGVEPEYSDSSLLFIWRLIYTLGAVILTYVLVSRYLHLTESQVWAEDKERRAQVERSRLLEAVMATREEELRNQPDLVPVTSSVSSLSAPSVTVDFNSHSVITSGLVSPSSDSPALAQHQILQSIPSTDPEDDLKASPVRLLLQNYGLRLLGASLSWLLWDIAFYGNKLFQSTFLLTLTGESTTLIEFSLAATLNAAVALLGYFGAAMLVDKFGRRNLQQYGFLVTGTLFVSCGFLYYELSSAVLVALYLGSSFFGQLGPNATTFLIPTEIFPTEMRTMCHGICAASGKLGALIAAVVFNSLDNDLDLFLLSGYASFVACLITFCTIPESSGLDLYEVDKKWRAILEGRKGDYKGEANHPRYLSYYERSRLYGNGSHVDLE